MPQRSILARLQFSPTWAPLDMVYVQSSFLSTIGRHSSLSPMLFDRAGGWRAVIPTPTAPFALLRRIASGHAIRRSGPLADKCGATNCSLLDHLVGQREQRWRYFRRARTLHCFANDGYVPLGRQILSICTAEILNRPCLRWGQSRRCGSNLCVHPYPVYPVSDKRAPARIDSAEAVDSVSRRPAVRWPDKGLIARAAVSESGEGNLGSRRAETAEDDGHKRRLAAPVQAPIPRCSDCWSQS